ncbi:class I SAM-dependent methyltransferase [Halonatronum saccharophilum]|uniref:class I SAM-dependent methyltransferase n=1 Tax=Halonatronum saccharophilum TaxID=150060 RepID=UPI000487B9DF|nr:class I SAM-dependent methyltransferase [Halonatronum saccharophilum]
MKFYQEFTKYYDDIFPFKEKTYDFLKEDLKENARVLDIATGSGNYSIALAQDGYKVSGIDLSSGMINLAKSKSEGLDIDFKLGDMKEISTLYSGEKFDFIFCIGNSLVHLDSRREIKEVLKSIYSLLKQDGNLIIQIVNYDRILDLEINKLPTISNQETGVKLIRNYKLGVEKVEFETELKSKEGNFENSVALLPLRSKELKEILGEIGFDNIKLFGGFDRSSYKPLESFPLVIKAKR